MIYSQTYVTSADNTGIKKLMCLGILGHGKYAGLAGDIIVAVVKEIEPNQSLQHAAIVKALVIRTTTCLRRADGTYLRFDDNAAVVIKKDKMPWGSKIAGPINAKIRQKKYVKITSLAEEVI
jgi:large subunit ribosomal protein L14